MKTILIIAGIALAIGGVELYAQTLGVALLGAGVYLMEVER